ncbi:MAG TPA: PhoH family protein [Kiritimatiellia bacterium]|jgi:PhoH-like ATPase|nr:PhoH family protein [Kiritimatiellia bacterium]HPW75856.1 PhoH family protein [Kiritimatiellia bacterium]
MPPKTPATRRKKKQLVKTFVLDTNVLLHSPVALAVFDDNHVVLPMAVLEELDKFKAQSSELGRNARESIRKLDALCQNGKLAEGVKLPGGGTLRVLATPEIEKAGLEEHTPDNALIRLAYWLERQGERVIIVSMDINVRVKANAVGLDAEDFEHEKVNFDELYCGYAEASVPRAVIERLYNGQMLTKAPVRCHPNMFLYLSATEEPDMKVIARVFPDGTLAEIDLSIDTVYGIQSRNIEQRMALELLMDPAVTLVTLMGQAGTGKTLLALAAGLHLVQREHLYDRILVSRPIVPLGKDIGYLPGDKEEKLSHWMEPIFDNLDYLLRKTQPNQLPPGAKKQPKMLTPQDRINQLLENDTLELEALTYIRGRSISRQFILIDEAQNLTPHEVKTVISRAGEGSKIILTGDPYQIDNPYLDASSNGLTYAAERLKELPLHGHVTLHQSERSQLAAAAAQYL